MKRRIRNLAWLASAALVVAFCLVIIVNLPGCIGAKVASPPNTEGSTLLSSWNDGATRKRLVTFVEDTTNARCAHFVPVAKRIAVFDNDGTLWVEAPIYTELAFVLARIKKLAPRHPEWTTQQPFKAALEDDHEMLAASGTKGLLELLVATHTGVTTEEFEEDVSTWIRTARHPRFNRLYTELAYQPMVELLIFLRARDFKTYIVSGGTAEFMRVFTERVYGVPPEQVIGTTLVTELEKSEAGQPILMRRPRIDFVDDGPGKPIAINRLIGRRPILAFGNSDGDLEMLEWTMAGDGARLAGIVHHTDATREFAYDRVSPVGRLDRALDRAKAHGWMLVDMKEDWKKIFAFE